jgi:hypothetical protein
MEFNFSRCDNEDNAMACTIALRCIISVLAALLTNNQYDLIKRIIGDVCGILPKSPIMPHFPYLPQNSENLPFCTSCDLSCDCSCVTCLKSTKYSDDFVNFAEWCYLIGQLHRRRSLISYQLSSQSDETT